MSDENEYSGSGHFVGGSESEAPKATKKSSISERQIAKKEESPVATAKEVNQTAVGQNAVAISNALGNPEPPIGNVLYGVAKDVAPWVLGTIGLKAAWDVLSSQKGQDSNDGSKSAWGKTTAGRPEGATLGAAPAPAPVAEAAPAPVVQQAAPAPAPAPAVQQAAPAPVVETPAPQYPEATKPVAPALQSLETVKPTYNQPTGAPNVAVAPPVEAAPAPVQPKPLDPIQQAKLDAINAAERRKDAAEARAAEAHAAEQRRRDEAHANRLAADAKRSELSSQKKTSSGISPQDRQMLQSSEKAKLDKAIAADQKAAAITKAPPPAAVVPPAAPAVEPVATTAPAAQAAAPEVKAAVPPKGAKWPGGAEGSALQLFGGTKKNLTPESMAALELFKGETGPLTMPPTGGTIHQIDQASKFYEKHTGEPLPRNAEGKLTRIPEEQMQKLHAGIRTELEDAVKGNKLGSLGKGAMAAAALLGLTGAVQAAQKGDFGPLRQAGFDIGGPVALGKLGIAALSRAAGTGFAAATYAGGLNEGEERELARRRYEFDKESQKLGSPLRSVPPPR
jgi:hypothetical protein